MSDKNQRDSDQNLALLRSEVLQIDLSIKSVAATLKAVLEEVHAQRQTLDAIRKIMEKT